MHGASASTLAATLRLQMQVQWRALHRHGVHMVTYGILKASEHVPPKEAGAATNATVGKTTACSRHSRWVYLLVIICLLSLPGSMLSLDSLLLLYQILNDCFFAEQKALWSADRILQAHDIYMLPQCYMYNALDIEEQQ